MNHSMLFTDGHNKHGLRIQNEITVDVLEFILQTFTRHHHEFIIELCKEIVKRKASNLSFSDDNHVSTNNTNNNTTNNNNNLTMTQKRKYLDAMNHEITIRDATDLATGRLIVKNKSELNSLLKEFIDHRIIDSRTINHIEYLKIMLTGQDIEKVSNWGKKTI